MKRVLPNFLAVVLLTVFLFVTKSWSPDIVLAGCCSDAECGGGQVCANMPASCGTGFGQGQGVCVSGWETCSGSNNSSSCSGGQCCVSNLCQVCGGGGGSNRCNGIGTLKHDNTGGANQALIDGQAITLTKIYNDGSEANLDTKTPNPFYWGFGDLIDGWKLLRLYKGTYKLTTTVPSGWGVSWTIAGNDSGSPNTGNGPVAQFYCGDRSSVDWFFTPLCTPVAPATVSLTSPADRASVSTATVNLLWNAPTSWGTACSGANNQYQVYVDNFIPPTTLRATVPAGTTNTTFTGMRGETYHWKVVASNGQATTSSPTWSFTILDNQIVGTVYNDPNNTCSQATPWSGVLTSELPS